MGNGLVAIRLVGNGSGPTAEQQTELVPPEADAGRLFSSRLVKTVNPHLDFRGDASEACEFYRGVFRGEFSYLPTIRDGGGDTPGVAEAELDWVRHVALPLTAGVSPMGSDMIYSWAADSSIGSNHYISIETDDVEEALDPLAGLGGGRGVARPQGYYEPHG